ncbi:hypothetical protein [Bradyrhizobium acaciae]|uniref:hypothetical protein n=1 Tax=Bradyrhizobium acaciae TaxID=2683706 RepID=UPI001E4B7050|nr:hypothetical protein [Bradyrhizobium acaciae]MCC8983208.1 hypothetical protein [Bradyrhizobium acaciae]
MIHLKRVVGRIGLATERSPAIWQAIGCTTSKSTGESMNVWQAWICADAPGDD